MARLISLIAMSVLGSYSSRVAHHHIFFASQQVILSVIGVPGALLAGWTVEIPYLGRRGSLAISTGQLSSNHLSFGCSFFVS